MDISTILPLLQKQKKGSNNSDNMQGIMDILAKSGGKKNDRKVPDSGTQLDPLTLMSMLGGGDNSQNANLVKILSTLNAQKSQENQKRLHGLKPIKAIACDCILGKLARYFN